MTEVLNPDTTVPAFEEELDRPMNDIHYGEPSDEPAKPTAGLFGDDPAAAFKKMQAIASILKQQLPGSGFVCEMKEHPGKLFPKVEAWVLAGSLAGISPVTRWTKHLPEIFGWEARAEAVGPFGRVFGAGESQCSRAEPWWHLQPDNSIRSMAQTRATAKALSQPLRPLMILAGFEGTPWEEMPSGPVAPHGNGQPRQQLNLSAIIQGHPDRGVVDEMESLLRACRSVEEVRQVGENQVAFHIASGIITDQGKAHLRKVFQEVTAKLRK